MYQNGKGSLPDYKKAFNWYQKSAFNGFSKVQYNLANMYVNGFGVQQDFNKATQWYNISADNKDKKGLIMAVNLLAGGIKILKKKDEDKLLAKIFMARILNGLAKINLLINATNKPDFLNE